MISSPKPYPVASLPQCSRRWVQRFSADHKSRYNIVHSCHACSARPPLRTSWPPCVGAARRKPLSVVLAHCRTIGYRSCTIVACGTALALEDRYYIVQALSFFSRFMNEYVLYCQELSCISSYSSIIILEQDVRDNVSSVPYRERWC